jgi:hypothetical protein
MITAKELAAKEQTRKNVKKETYRALLEQFCRKIRTASDLGQKEVLLSVPPFVIGYPAYNMPITVDYMGRQLERLGYKVFRAGLVDLLVKWNVKADPISEIQDSCEDLLPTLMNLQKTAAKYRSKR